MNDENPIPKEERLNSQANKQTKAVKKTAKNNNPKKEEKKEMENNEKTAKKFLTAKERDKLITDVQARKIGLNDFFTNQFKQLITNDKIKVIESFINAVDDKGNAIFTAAEKALIESKKPKTRGGNTDKVVVEKPKTTDDVKNIAKTVYSGADDEFLRELDSKLQAVFDEMNGKLETAKLKAELAAIEKRKAEIEKELSKQN